MGVDTRADTLEVLAHERLSIVGVGLYDACLLWTKLTEEQKVELSL